MNFIYDKRDSFYDYDIEVRTDIEVAHDVETEQLLYDESTGQMGSGDMMSFVQARPEDGLEGGCMKACKSQWLGKHIYRYCTAYLVDNIYIL